MKRKSKLSSMLFPHLKLDNDDKDGKFIEQIAMEKKKSHESGKCPM
jgi:hypothetical protein